MKNIAFYAFMALVIVFAIMMFQNGATLPGMG